MKTKTFVFLRIVIVGIGIAVIIRMFTPFTVFEWRWWAMAFGLNVLANIPQGDL